MKRKQQIYLIIVIAVLIFAVASSTYAFLNLGDRSYGGNIPLGTATDMGATFTAYSNGNIEISADINELLPPETVEDISTTFIKNETANITVRLDPSNRDDATSCTYDLVWVWDSEDQYKTPSIPLPYSHPSGKTYNYEFSVKVDNVEQNLSNLKWNGNKAVITTKSIAVSKGESKTEEYNVYVRLYNLPVAQKALDSKNFKAHIEVSDAKCRDTKTLELVANENSSKTLANVIKAQYKVDGDNDLYYHDGKGDYINASLEAGDNSYRYSGEDPNNYVCFGSSEEVCPEDNLYRIIGVFGNNVKLIKTTYASSSLLGTDGDYYSDNNYYWNRNNGNSENSNIWSTSNLNNVNLNTNYLKNIGNWSEAIVAKDWITSGLKENQISEKNAKEIYTYEVAPTCSDCIEKLTQTTVKRKVGLVYVSDYMYAARPEKWSLHASGASATNYCKGENENWLYNGSWQMTISKKADYNHITAGYTCSIGNNWPYSSSYKVYPVFYLKDNIEYISGSGTKADPIRITDNYSTPAETTFAQALINEYNDGNPNNITLSDSSSSSSTTQYYYYANSAPNNYVVFKDDSSIKYRIYYDYYYKSSSNSISNYVWLFSTTSTGSTRQFNSSNNTGTSAGFSSSTLYSYLNGTYKSNLSTVKQNLISSVSLPSSGEYSSYIKPWFKPSSSMWTSTVPGSWNSNYTTYTYKGTAYYIDTSGGSGTANKTTYYSVYPTFKLQSTVKLLAGSGTYYDPYIIY